MVKLEKENNIQMNILGSIELILTSLINGACLLILFKKKKSADFHAICRLKFPPYTPVLQVGLIIRVDMVGTNHNKVLTL